jgi:hypothetical protein
MEVQKPGWLTLLIADAIHQLGPPKENPREKKRGVI